MSAFELAEIEPKFVEEIKNRLVLHYNKTDLLNICRYACAYDGSFEELDAFPAERIADYLDTSNAYELVRIVANGKVDLSMDYLRWNCESDTLESVDGNELKQAAFDRIDEIAAWVVLHCENLSGYLREKDMLLIGVWRSLVKMMEE